MTTPEAASTTPNHHSEPERVNKRAFTIAEIAALRARLNEVTPADGESPEDFAIRQKLNSEQEISTYATTNGFNERHQKYNILTTQLQDIVETPDYNWYVGPRVYEVNALGVPLRDADGNAMYENAPSGQEKVWALQGELFGGILSETAGDDQHAVPTDASTDGRYVFSDEQLAIRDAYRTGDAQLARAEARRFRVGMLAGKEKRNQIEAEIEPAAIAYINQAQLFDEVQEQKYRTMFPDISDEALAKKMASYHTAKQRLHDLRTEHEAENGYHKFGALSKAHNKISSWYGGLSRKEKLGVAGAGVVAAGLLGLALSPLGAAGVGILAGAKGYRSYMQSRSKLYERPTEVETIQSTNEQGSKTLDDLQIEARDKMTAARSERIEKTDKVNRSARITTALGGLVLGGALVQQAVEHWGDIQHFFGGRDAVPQDGINGAPGETPPPVEVPRVPVPPEAPDVIKPSDTPDVADAIRDSFGGEGSPSGDWAPGNVDNYITGDLGATEFTPAGLGNFHQWVDGYSVRSGDSIWSLSENYLHAQGVANPSVYQIDAVKDTVLADFKARGLVGANGWLSAGQSLHIK